MLTRFPQLRLLPVENGSAWVRPLVEGLQRSYEKNPTLWDEDPFTVLKRNVWVHPFHEDDPHGLVKLLGSNRVVFGSDFPHPEGIADPLSYVEDLAGLPHDDVARIMGGNLAEVMGVAA
jgi:hypothetical protein